MTPQAIWEGLNACTLGEGEFKHRHHLQAAWFVLSQMPLTEAGREFISAIQRFATHVGVPDLYHETITLFYLYDIDRRRRMLNDSHDWDAFESANEDLFDHRALMARYYDPAALESPFAKRHFLPPAA